MKKINFLLITLLVNIFCHATIIHIPAEQPTILAGINIALNGDTVLVHPGTYFENINFIGKNITVASMYLITQDTSFISQTVINGGGGAQSPVAVFENGEDSTAVLVGFTLTNGCNYRGGGIYCIGASPTLSYLTICGNFTHYWNGYSRGGGGIYCENSNLTLENSIIINNSAMTASCPAVGLDCGGGIYCMNSDILLQNVLVSDNTAESGGGMYCDHSNPHLQNVTISNNTVIPDYNPLWWVYFDSFGGGMSLVNGSDPVLRNVTISDNAAVSGFSQYSSAFGGGIYCSGSSPDFQHVLITNNSVTGSMGGVDQKNSGGGLYCTDSSPAFQDVDIKNNTAKHGGGIYIEDQSNPHLSDVIVSSNAADDKGGGIYCSSSCPEFDSINRCNVYLNSALGGSDLYSDTLLQVIVDTFTVLFPTEYHAGPLENFSFDILEGKQQQVDADLYVSPSGDNTNSGLTPGEPLKNIRNAFSIIRADSLHHNTIHLLTGTYSDSSNQEIFPLNIPDYINISGESENAVILDAKLQSNVLTIHDNAANQITRLTITGGNDAGLALTNSNPDLFNLTISGSNNGIHCDNSNPVIDSVSIINNTGNGICCVNGSNPLLTTILIAGNASRGLICENGSDPVLENVIIEENQDGGIACYSSSPHFQNVTISGNTSAKGGGYYGEHSSPEMHHVTISNNTSSLEGGGMYCSFSDPVFKNVIISHNTSDYGGGMYLSCHSKPDMEFVTINDNQASTGGGIYCSSSIPHFNDLNRCNIFLNNAYQGNDLWSNSYLEVAVDTFTVLFPTKFHADPIDNFCFDILNCKIEQVNADLYVSPLGDNTNSGLTADDPLKTIHYAFSVILADNLNPHTIFLSDGIYSPSSNGEFFPVNMLNYICLTGASEEGAILDAEGIGNVVTIDNTSGNCLSEITITGGSSNGISINASNPLVQNISISDNNDAGIYCDNASPVTKNLLITQNETGYCCENSSNPDIINVAITGNNVGMACKNASGPRLQNVEISGNDERGIICNGNSGPFLENVLISNNSGGGMQCSQSSPVLKHVTISENSIDGIWSGGYGGGINCVDHSSPLLENVLITGNSVSKSWLGDGGWGGGIYCNDFSNPVLKNVQFSGNTAEHTGAGMACYSDCNPVLVNVTMTGNNSENTGGAIYSYLTSNPLIVNSIFWNDLPHEVFATFISINYSDIQGGWEGNGNIDADPLFVGSGDYPYALSDDSPCINAGTQDTTGLNLPEYDLAGNPRLIGGRIDLGAYENQNVATGIVRDVSVSDYGFSCAPNPFSGETTILFHLKSPAGTKVEVCNSKGQIMDVLSDEHLNPGKYALRWEPQNLSPGIYFLRLHITGEEPDRNEINSEFISLKIVKY